MSTITPANPDQIAEFYKAASTHLSSMGIDPQYHEALLSNELGAQYNELNKSAFMGNPKALDKVSPGEVVKYTGPKTVKIDSVLKGGGGKAGLVKKLLAALGIGGAGFAAGAATGGGGDDKEAMDKEVPSCMENLEVDKGEGESEADGDGAKGVVVKKTKIKVLKEAMDKVKSARSENAEKEAEAAAHEALFKAAKAHMVENLNIPEKKAQEILEKHYADVTAAAQ
jgi:hypothetical protein